MQNQGDLLAWRRGRNVGKRVCRSTSLLVVVWLCATQTGLFTPARGFPNVRPSAWFPPCICQKVSFQGELTLSRTLYLNTFLGGGSRCSKYKLFYFFFNLLIMEPFPYQRPISVFFSVSDRYYHLTSVNSWTKPRSSCIRRPITVWIGSHETE